MMFKMHHRKALLAMLEAERAAHAQDLKELQETRERLAYARERANRQSRTIEQQAQTFVALGGKINALRQLCDAAGNSDSHVTIEHVRHIVGEA